jgi:type I restriction enzyme, S subunit
MSKFPFQLIGEITTLIKDGTHGTHKDVLNGIPLLSAKDIENGKVKIPNDCRKITETDYRQIHATYELKSGDLLLTLVGTIGRTAIFQKYNQKITFQRSVGFLRFKPEIDNEYAYYVISSDTFLRSMIKSMNASAQGGVYLGELAKLKIPTPPLPQQKKIAKILSTCDRVIEKTEAAIAKYEAIKQGMMHDLFTRGIDLKSGKLRLRFEEAPELYKESELGWIPKEWEVRASSTVCEFFNGRAYHISEWEEKGTPVIRLQNLTGSGDTYYFSTLKLPENQYCYKNDLLYMWSASFGPFIWSKDKAIYHYHIWKVNCFETKLDKLYFFYELEEFTKSVLKGASGSTMAHITKEGMEKRLLPLPSYKEQIKIRKAILSIDGKMNAEKIELKKIQKIKKGLMQDLLTGKVEVEVSDGN